MIRKTLFLVLLMALASPALAQSDADFKAHMQAGKAHVDAKEYGKAILEFQEALLVKPSSKGAVFNIAYCHLRLNQLSQALNKFEAYIGMNPGKTKSQKARMFVEQISMELSKTRALVTITTEPPGAAVYWDGEPAGDSPKTPTSFWAAPGKHKLQIKLHGHVTETLYLRVKAGAEVAESFALVKEQGRTIIQDKPEVQEKSHAGPWVTVGLGGATGVAGLVLYLVARQNFIDANDDFDSGKIDEVDYDSQWEDATGKATAGYVLMGVGGAALLGGVIWRIAQGSDKNSQSTTAFQVMPTRNGLVGGFSLTF